MAGDSPVFEFQTLTNAELDATTSSQPQASDSTIEFAPFMETWQYGQRKEGERNILMEE